MGNMDLKVYKAAENLSDDMIIELANSLYEGINGYEKDEKGARGLLADIALRGNAEAQYILYSIWDNSDEIDKAIKWLKMAVEQGHPEAKAMFFIEYADGNIDDIDDEIAVTALMEAADYEIPIAMFVLSNLYDEGGFGIEENHDLTWHYCKKSAQFGFPMAQYAMYEYLISEDRDLALTWLRKAAENGYGEAQYTLWKESSKEAFSWLEKARDQDNLDALFDYARLQETDIFVARDSGKG